MQLPLALSHPDNLLHLTAFSLSLFLSSTISFAPLTLLLATLLVYVQHTIHRKDARMRLALLWGSLSIGISVAHIFPSIHALSSPAVSIIVLAALSSITPLVALSTVIVDTLLTPRLFPSSWSQITVFPTIWATTWFIVSKVSFVGRLMSWSPTVGFAVYAWIPQWAGPIGIDWVTAAWAVIIVHTFNGRFGTSEPSTASLVDHPLPQDVVPHKEPKPTNFRSVMVLGTILTALALPSFILSDLPLPTISPETTPFDVGCILPNSRHLNRAPSLDDFIVESRKWISKADILLWPEGAVRFEDADARNKMLEKIGQDVPGHLIGVGFEEFDSSETNAHGRRRTGLALIRGDQSSGTTDVRMMYYKRHLVPSTPPIHLFFLLIFSCSFSQLPNRSPSLIPKNHRAYTR
jgi:hypothetical protein